MKSGLHREEDERGCRWSRSGSGRTGECECKENDLRNIHAQGKEDADLESFHGPDIYAPDFLPCSERGKAGERDETDHRVDIETGVMGPLLVENGRNNKGKTVEEVRQAC